jgi:class 3 adenylate cyclase/Tfp pilus assembly protein PilF
MRLFITPFVLCLLLLAARLVLQAQTSIDTLNDYNRAYALIDARKYPEAIEKYLSFIAAERSSAKPDLEKISESLNNIGICYYMMNNYHEAIAWYKKALVEDLKTGNPVEIATRYSNIGLAYKKLGNYDSAVTYYDKALLLDIENKDTQDIAKSYNNLGSIYDSWGRYDTAILFYENSLQFKQHLKDSAGMAISLNNIGLVYRAWGKYDEAIRFIEEALAIDRALGKVSEIPRRLNNIGLAYNQKNEYDKALEYFQEALAMAREQKNDDLLAVLYANIGNSYFKQEKYDDAIKYLQLALDLYQQMGRQVNIAAVYANLADIYKARNNYNQSIGFLSQSTKIAEQISLQDQLKNNYLLYSDIYAAMGNYPEALNYYKKYVTIKDTLFSEEIHKQITDFQIKYETEKKDKEITLLKQKEVIQALTIKKDRIYRNSLIGIIGLLVLLAVVIYFSLRQKRKANKIIIQEKDQSEKLLLNILPAGIAHDLKEKGSTEPQLYENVTVCFSDIVGFTEQSARLEPKVLIDELNNIFTAFDTIVENQRCERIKTIGDSYMAVCGLPEANADHAMQIIRTAVEMVQYLEKKNLESNIEWHMRVGIHSGPVIAGVVGIKKYIYDVFGDTINTASRMECASEPMRINVSEVTYNLVKDQFKFEERGAIEVKGKGMMNMYFIRV